MSLGLDTLQQSWQNLGLSSNQGGTGSGNSSSSLSSGIGVAGLQTPSSVNSAAAGLSSNANIPGINQITMPSWLSTNPNANLSELTSVYAAIPAAFDPTAQVAARNNAIGYNTSAGNQAANNAGTQYANQAAQSGASGLGAGTVRAQNLMPVLQQNAALKTDAADVAAKSYQAAATLASQVAGTIGQLRTSYLQTLTGYAQGQQQLALDTYKAQQSSAATAAQTALGYASQRADLYKANLSAQQQQSDNARLAATTLLGQKGPTGEYQTDNNGNVISGQSAYNALKAWQSSQGNAQTALAGMF